MNERIRELAKQAAPDYTGMDSLDMGHALVGDEEIKRFAELIVQECADYIRSNLDTDQAEPLAWNLEIQYGLHGDYAE